MAQKSKIISSSDHLTGDKSQIATLLSNKTVRIDNTYVTVRRFTDTPIAAQGVVETQTKSKTQTSTPGSARKNEARLPKVQALPPSGSLQMLIRETRHQTQVVLMEGPIMVEHYVERPDTKSLIGNLYIGVIRAVVPSLEAVFVDIGVGAQGILRPPGGISKLSEGDRIMVRVVKDSHGKKGPKLKTDVSLTGRYLVILPASPKKVAVSRHLTGATRERLLKTARKIKPAKAGLIVRSAAQDASAKDLSEDMSRLMTKWTKVSNLDITKGAAPRSVFEEPSLPVRIVREHFTSDFKRLIVDSPKLYDQVCGYLRTVDPDLIEKISLHEGSVSLFERFHITDQLRKALERRVYLPSGGHLVIDRTEALTAIDVNTGRFSSSKSHAETIFINNIEAAEAAAREIRLRDIGGIIVLDFVDMDSQPQRDAVLKSFRQSLAKDRTTADVFAISQLGLVEMSRKRRSASMLEDFSSPCLHCEGRGVILHQDAVASGVAIPKTPSKAGNNGSRSSSNQSSKNSSSRKKQPVKKNTYRKNNKSKNTRRSSQKQRSRNK